MTATGEYTYKPKFYLNGSLCTEIFYKNEKFHRDGDNPALIFYRADGSVETASFYKNGKKYEMQPIED